MHAVRHLMHTSALHVPQEYGFQPNPHKGAMHKRMDTEPDLWTKRPLDGEVLKYAGTGAYESSLQFRLRGILNLHSVAKAIAGQPSYLA